MTKRGTEKILEKEFEDTIISSPLVKGDEDGGLVMVEKLAGELAKTAMEEALKAVGDNVPEGKVEGSYVWHCNRAFNIAKDEIRQKIKERFTND